MDYSAFQNIKIQFKFSTFPILVFPLWILCKPQHFLYLQHFFYTYNISFVVPTKASFFYLGVGHISPLHPSRRCYLFLITLKLVNKNRGFWKLKHILGKPSLFLPPPTKPGWLKMKYIWKLDRTGFRVWFQRLQRTEPTRVV